MSKKRKEPPQSSTRTNLFTPGCSEGGGHAKSKRRTAPSVDERKTTLQPIKGEVKDEPEDRRLRLQEPEIIVIDSDDDVEVVAQLVEDSSDVEIIEEPTPCKQKRKPSRSGMQLSPNTKKEESPTTLRDTSSKLSFQQANVNKPTTTPDSIPPKEEQDEWDWDMGDELDREFVSNGLLVEDGEVKEEDLNGLVEIDDGVEESALEPCPMCGITFLDLDFAETQAHVNTCLDDQATNAHKPSSSKTPAPRKPLRPLSTLFPTVGPSTASKFSMSSDSKSKVKPANAFSVLMSETAERERAAWAEAQAAEDRRPTRIERKKAPFYKVLTGMPIAVDAFRYRAIPGIEAYFLTHAHSDHYTSLSKSWKNGPIYCSETTANLIVLKLSVDRKWIHPLPMDKTVEIPNTGGVKVTLIDANHCPGSCLFLFEGPQTINAGDSAFKSPFVGTARIFRYLHCGDFRACPQHVLHPSIKGQRLDVVYLDTTYLNPKYCFPPQPLVIDACAELARRIVNGESLDGDSGKGKTTSIRRWITGGIGKGKDKDKKKENGDVLVVIGTYSIGKERIVKAVAKALNTKVYCDARRTSILRCQDDPELHALLTTKPLEAGVHVVRLGQVSPEYFNDYVSQWKGHWARVVGFRPTGWTYSPPKGTDLLPPVSRVVATAQTRTFTYLNLKPARNSTPSLMQYGVPYSEHSSFAELTCFMLSVDCTRVVATVNVGSAAWRAKMAKWVEKWDSERKRRKETGMPAIVEFREKDYW